MKISEISRRETFDEVLFDPAGCRHHAIHHVVLHEPSERLARLKRVGEVELSIHTCTEEANLPGETPCARHAHPGGDEIGREAKEYGAVGTFTPGRIRIMILLVFAEDGNWYQLTLG